MPEPRTFRHVKRNSRFHIGDVKCLLKRRDRIKPFDATKMHEAFRIDLDGTGADGKTEYPVGSYLVKNHQSDADAVWVFPGEEDRRAFKPAWFGLFAEEVAAFPDRWLIKAEKIWMEF